MTYETFLQQILDLGIKPQWYIPDVPEKSRWITTKLGFWYESQYTSEGVIYKKMAEELVDKKKKIVELPTIPRYIQVTWETGGTSGGGYRDEDSPQAFSTGTPEPEFEDLDKILEHFTPNIGFLKYKRIVRECVQIVDWTVNEYYGNSSNKMAKYVDLEELYRELDKDGLLKD